MIIKILVGPKEKEYYEKKCALMSWDADEIEVAIMEDVNECFYDMIQCAPNGIEFVEVDEDFNQASTDRQLKRMAENNEED